MKKTKNLCEYCEKDKKRNARFCSKACWYKSNHMYRRCQCGKEFRVQIARVNQGLHRYCSRKCSSRYRRGDNVIKRCRVCSKAMTIQPYQHQRGRGKYCSIKCFNKSKYTGKYVNCATCNKKVYKIKSQLKTRNYCSNKCWQTRNK